MDTANQGNQIHQDKKEGRDTSEALCPSCGVHNGQPHLPQCDVARCQNCGGQRLTCTCAGNGEDGIPWGQEQGHDAVPWGGDWPGAAECRRRAWWAKMVPGEGWRPCAEGDIGASEDLNRLAFFQQEGHDGLYDRH